jgi:hypothetical protein
MLADQRVELIAQATRHRQAEDIRHLVYDVREALSKGLISKPDVDLEAWSRWALSEADGLDPVCTPLPIFEMGVRISPPNRPA